MPICIHERKVRSLANHARGSIRTGNWADLAVFEPQQFGERGTVFEPNQTATGMRHVLVNGTFALRDGQLTGQRGGHVLRR